jgi:molecular chaperone DnaK (HSP70)
MPELNAKSQRCQIQCTDYKTVANYEGTNVEIIANEQGSFTTPSFVSFTDKERLIGESAKNQAAMNPRNTIFDIKLVAHFLTAMIL